MLLRHGGIGKRVLRAALPATLALLCALSAAPAHAALLPTNFFDKIPSVHGAQAGVEADQLHFNSDTGEINAVGDVGLTYLGYFAKADRLVFNQKTRDLSLFGNIVIVDPDGTEYRIDEIHLTGQFKNAVLDQMVMVTANGAQVTATQLRRTEDGRTYLDDGTYSPCGDCIDEHGHKIGWRVRTKSMMHDRDGEYVELEQPVLEVLGIPIGWLPWIRMPDPNGSQQNGFKLPSAQYSDAIGVKLNIPYFHQISPDLELLFTTSLISAQGVMLTGELNQKFDGFGAYMLRTSGIWQLDPATFTGKVGNRNFRGSFQTTGEFTPLEDFKTGWSYTAFTDPAYLKDYFVPTENPVVNEVYAQYLTTDTYVDARVQEFVLLGEITAARQAKQGHALPTITADHVVNLGQDAGELRFKARLLGVTRAADATRVAPGPVNYVLGYQGNKTHASFEASWRKQFIAPGGLVATTLAGIRGDAAFYDGASVLKPGATSLLTATPFAALDIRYPLIASTGEVTHFVEPIMQLSYRASSVSNVGINNDDAQSFIFDDTNLFSFNRFSGIDRQETGLRANIGARYQVMHNNGSYLDILIGQSFHLAGINSYTTADGSQAATSSGLGTSSSYMIAGVSGQFNPTLKFGAKVQLNPASMRIARGGANIAYDQNRVKVGLDYAYLAADAALGITSDRHDIYASLGVPVAEYIIATGEIGWDLTSNTATKYGIELEYDDGYVVIGGEITSPGATLTDPTTWAYKLNFKLKGPDGSNFGT